ncbi:hypothetical protein JW935_04900 [candidate division KSB1 bacterium]|nr:hypothetical protein [candidate division KSB1 bacterium]
MRFKRLTVQCYSGYRGDERPVSFVYEDKTYEIIEIVDRWVEGSLETEKPFVYYFRVLTTMDEFFILRMDPAGGDWHILIG